LLARRNDQTDDVALIRMASQFLYEQRGIASIPRLAVFVNLSERSLAWKFLQTTGFSPKMLARIVRFNFIRNDLMHRPQQSLTDLALRYQYFDQAHFIHDFASFTGQAPLAFARDVSNGLIRFYK